MITARLPMQATPEMLAAVGRGYCDEWRPYRTQEAAKLYELMVKAHLQSPAASAPKPERPEEPRCCPFCGSDDIRFVTGIQARNAAESLNLDLDEYQCDSCRETFWV